MIKKLFFIAACISLCLSQLIAAPVSQQDAGTVAFNFYKGNTAYTSAYSWLTLKYTRTEDDGTVDYYVFDVAPHGFVIVAGDDNIQPVIAYSTESNFQLGFERTGVKDWTDHAAQHIHQGILSRIPADARISRLWASYRQGPHGPGSRSAVAPMLTTTWDQSPYYNSMCPLYIPDNQRAVTGCVATSMAQIMKHWNYPTTGNGSFTYTDSVSRGYTADYGVYTADFGTTTYQWASMPNSINGNNSAIATLMFHCGVAVAMDYGDDRQGGSGAWVIQQEAGGDTMPCAEYAFRHYFKYDTLTLQGIREIDYTSTQWIAIIKNDLDAGRPIQYEGDDLSEGGHAWVCDGYDANDMLHMNWGWSGSDDGYYAVNTLTAGGANFNQNEGALIGIQPPPPFRVTAQAADAMVCHGSSTQLTANGPASATYSWSPTTGVACPTCAITSVAPTATTIYTVTGDSAGVLVRYSVMVTVAAGISAAFDAPVVRACAAPADFIFTNTSQFASHYVWDFGDGSILSTDTSPVHTYSSYGTYPVKLVVTGSCGTDSVIRTQYITVSDITPSASGTSVCNGNSATLTASLQGTSAAWFATATGGAAIDTNAIFQTPAVTATTTYYLEAQIQGQTQHAGPATDAFGTGGNFANTNGHSVLFDCHRPQVLRSVDVYAQGAGVRTISLLDTYGDVIDSASINVPAGHSTVTLNWDLPMENNLQLNASNTINLYRNQSGATYPYYSADSSVVLTGSDAGPAYYYFFYNWQLQAPACVSTRIPVQVSVLNGSANFTALANSLSVDFAPVVTSGVTYQWSFGDGNTSTDQHPNHTYTASGTYTVQLIESNGSCTDTLTQQVDAFATGITDLGSLHALSVYPVPAHDQIAVKLSASQAAICQMTITDMIGQVTGAREVKLNAGSNMLHEDVTSYSSGVYFITLSNGKARTTARFVKE
ncbi:MAG: Peptidase family protein [Bacteroidetes bacterium]|nr:Peptidase family protein [Bacteroidota bacterium]